MADISSTIKVNTQKHQQGTSSSLGLSAIKRAKETYFPARK
jgi:hypothetical protein